MIDFWTGLGESLCRGEPVWLALVAASSRHSPGTAGSRLWVAAQPGGESRRYGTIGGGALEHRLIERVRRAAGAGEESLPDFEIRTYHHRRRVAEGVGPEAVPSETSGLICSGWQTHVHLLCRPERDLPAVEELLGLLASGTADEERTKSGEGGGIGSESMPAAPILTIGAEGLAIEHEPLDWSRPAIELQAERGAGPVYRQRLISDRRAAVMGAGHCGRALAACLARLGYEVELFDSRPTIADEARTILDRDPAGQRVRVRPIDDFTHAGGSIIHPEITPVVVMTTALAQDVRALVGALPSAFPFVGVMGSEAKLEEIRQRLRVQGIAEEDLRKLVAPVGLAIDSRTPEEIAISVAGQILASRNSWLPKEHPIFSAPHEVHFR